MVTTPAPFLATARKKYARYSRHVLGYRHFAEGRDGLLPVRRRSLWAMHKIGAVDKSHMTATAKIVGATMGDYHPHEDGSISSAIAGMTQAESRTPPIMGVGQWGDHNQDMGAIRYTKAYMSRYALTMFEDDELSCVPLDPTYNGKGLEPRFLPVRLPHLLIAGCESLAPGYSGNIPPCSYGWVADAVHATMRGRTVSSPKDFAYRWGGRLIKLENSWVKTGKGVAVFSPRMSVGSGEIFLHSLAPRRSLEKIEYLIENDDAFAGMVEQPPDKGPVKVIIKVKRGHNVNDFARRIFSACKISSHYSFLSIQQNGPIGEDDYHPIIEGPRTFLAYWVDWRKTIVVGAARHRIGKMVAEINRIQFLLRVIDKRKELDRIRDQWKDNADLRVRVMKLFNCTSEQASMVIAIPWPRLAKMEAASLKGKWAECRKEVDRNRRIVSKPDGEMESNIQSTLVAIEATIKEAALLSDAKRRK
jgi:DNA gyrase subunit A